MITDGHYNDSRIYRVVPGWVAQFGYAGDPSRQRAQTIIADDPLPSLAQNLRGVLSFSASYSDAMDHATNRTTELYINLDDHLQLDALGFTPIAIVVRGGMSTVDAFYSGYGEMVDACALHGFEPCDGPSEARILDSGNAYLDSDFPQLTHIIGAAVIADDVPNMPASQEQQEDLAQPGLAQRVELHCHLDGSVPVAELLKISRRRNLSLPGLGGRVPDSTQDVWTAMRSMGPIWRWFDLVNEIIGGDEVTLFQVAYDFVGRQSTQHVAYSEGIDTSGSDPRKGRHDVLAFCSILPMPRLIRMHWQCGGTRSARAPHASPMRRSASRRLCMRSSEGCALALSATASRSTRYREGSGSRACQPACLPASPPPLLVLCSCLPPAPPALPCFRFDPALGSCYARCVAPLRSRALS